jgi:hypothetical protein
MANNSLLNSSNTASIPTLSQTIQNHATPVGLSIDTKGAVPELPYKVMGYPAFCRHLASDKDYFLFRRFGELNIRVLLNLQHEIEALSRELEKLDKQCADDLDDHALLNSLMWDKHQDNPYPERANILDQLQPLLHTYSQLRRDTFDSSIANFPTLDKHLTVYGQLRDRESAQQTQVQNVKNWLRYRSNPNAANTGPVLDKEIQYLDAGSDLICMVPQHSSPLERLLGRARFCRWLTRKHPKRGQTADCNATYYSAKKMEWLANTITVVLGLMMLYGPMWWLNSAVDDVHRLAIITVFVFFFAIGLSLIGSGKPFETLAATAAYAAVLMVFMQKQSSGTRGG